MVLTADGEVHTNEEAQVYVHDQNLFVTVQLLEETLAVLSLGKLCSEHGCSYEWKNGKNSTIDPKWEDNYLYNEQLRTSCRTRIVIISRGCSASTLRPKDQSNSSGESEQNGCRQILTSWPGETVDQHTKKTR